MRNDNDRLTKWLPPNATMSRTQYGVVTTRRWMELECTRLEKGTRRKYTVVERTLKEGLAIAIVDITPEPEREDSDDEYD